MIRIQRQIKEIDSSWFAVFSDWRLPSLEEAMSLMETEKNRKGLYLHPLFPSSPGLYLCQRHPETGRFLVCRF